MESKKDLDLLVENFFKPKKKKTLLNLGALLEMVEQAMDADVPLLTEEEQVRFSATIAIPRLSPTEAFGDPGSQSRKEINKVFASITGGQDIKARLGSVNAFLDPQRAARKRSPRVILNMMMIVETLQATLNDFNESAAGFVFEGFMAALTGGKQIAGRVKGTLPIEDFVAFSEFGADQPVSLKLLAAGGEIKGSFTNLVDFLLVRGAPAIKYLIAYKTTTSKGGVENLQVLAFDITRENFVDFVTGSLGTDLLSPHNPREVAAAFAQYAADPEGELPQLAKLVIGMSGYQRAGLLHKFVETGEFEKELSPEEEEEKAAAYDALSYKKGERVRSDIDWAKEAGYIREALQTGALVPNVAYHQLEKLSMQAEELFAESYGGGSQWKVSWPQLRNLGTTVNLEVYGELDLSQQNITELVEIYSEILGQELKDLLENFQDLTQNIGVYYAAKKRSKGQAAGRKAEENAEEIKQNLEADPMGHQEETE